MTNTSQDPEPDDPRTQRVPRDARRPRRWACSARAVGWLRQACRERGAALRVADRRSIVIAMLGLTVALGPGGCGDEARPSTIPSNGGEAPANRAPTVVQGPSGASGAIREVLEGRASYYADSLAGNPTASGEPYDPRAYTAASRDLPFGTRVRVTRLDDDGRPMASVIVRVNDRGPHRDHSRILDLSRAAAEALDMIRAGVVDIRAEVLAD